MVGRDVTDLIERLEAFEDRLDVSLEGLFAKLYKDIDRINLNGEIHPRIGAKLHKDVKLVATVYDSDGRVIETSSTYFFADSYFGFEVFSLPLDIGDIQPVKIRVYPQDS